MVQPSSFLLPLTLSTVMISGVPLNPHGGGGGGSYPMDGNDDEDLHGFYAAAAAGTAPHVHARAPPPPPAPAPASGPNFSLDDVLKLIDQCPPGVNCTSAPLPAISVPAPAPAPVLSPPSVPCASSAPALVMAPLSAAPIQQQQQNQVRSLLIGSKDIQGNDHGQQYYPVPGMGTPSPL